MTQAPTPMPKFHAKTIMSPLPITFGCASKHDAVPTGGPPASADRNRHRPFPEHGTGIGTGTEKSDLTDSDFLPIFTPHYRTKTRFP